MSVRPIAKTKYWDIIYNSNNTNNNNDNNNTVLTVLLVQCNSHISCVSKDPDHSSLRYKIDSIILFKKISIQVVTWSLALVVLVTDAYM